MKPKVLEDTMSATSNVGVGHIPIFANSMGTELNDSYISYESVSKLVENLDNIITHLADEESHITDKERISWNKRESIVEHTLNTELHVSNADREYWNEKESVEGAQAKADRVMASLNDHIYDETVHITQYEKNRLKEVYSKIEVDQLFDQLHSNTMWKEAVNSYEDLFEVYPDPIDGWTVNILDSDLTYRYDGFEWVCISANVIPVATEFVDGKMSKEDKLKLNGIQEGANLYIHPEDAWNRHVTDDQIAAWTAKAENVLATHDNDGLLLATDKVKLDKIEDGANNYIHPATHSARMIDQTDDLLFVSKEEKETWSAKADNRVASWYVSGLMEANDKKKLDNISENANLYIHPLNHEPSIIAENEDKQFVSAQNKITWNNKFGRGDFIRGSKIFNGVTGQRITHDLNDMNLTYSVIITVTSCNTPSKLGVVWVEKTPTEIIVYSSGGNIADSFDYLIIVD